jgi:hypothetical protein
MFQPASHDAHHSTRNYRCVHPLRERAARWSRQPWSPRKKKTPPKRPMKNQARAFLPPARLLDAPERLCRDARIAGNAKAVDSLRGKHPTIDLNEIAGGHFHHAATTMDPSELSLLLGWSHGVFAHAMLQAQDASSKIKATKGGGEHADEWRYYLPPEAVCSFDPDAEEQLYRRLEAEGFDPGATFTLMLSGTFHIWHADRRGQLECARDRYNDTIDVMPNSYLPLAANRLKPWARARQKSATSRSAIGHSRPRASE